MLCTPTGPEGGFNFGQKQIEPDEFYPRPSTSVMSTLGPMVVMEGTQSNGQMPPNSNMVQMAPQGPYFHQIPNQIPPQFMTYRGPPPGQHISVPSSAAPPPAPSTTSLNRSQRCGVCRGCQCKPCGQCTYCQDSPQFGGPGVKKQSCVERRCLRVLENRLQRDAPTFKARVGCNQCEDCKLPDCQTCLVCLDKRFFDNRYMTGALCAKKRCNNATSLELPIQNNNDRNSMKRSYDHSNNFEYGGKRMMNSNGMPGPQVMMQRQIMPMIPQDPYAIVRLQNIQQMPQQQMQINMQQFNSNSLLMPMNLPPNSISENSLMNHNSLLPLKDPSINKQDSLDMNPPTPNSLSTPTSSMNLSNPLNTQCNIQSNLQQSVPSTQNLLMNNTIMTSSSPAMYSFSPINNINSPYMPYSNTPPNFMPNDKMFYGEYHDMKQGQNGVDPFTPPSYAPETKSAVILQQL
ncbi:unnamed protein product [Bursaphelenchus xylophilus]|uniref:(pine wood nematode) hypothetical protein n=1 Tax=Bursaphelenchus xylophilus TaxID=6326 RepID=A0A1I7RYY9_BURXY|nr:unnamed protein product [Bursaphelenchus xylophilus]CAG9107024.1 unnamed protein product [Bursaphelenchus xylophilus]